MAAEKHLFKNVLRPESSPVVFSNFITTWPARKWSVKYLADILGNSQLQCKIAPLDFTDLKWENECAHLRITLHQYMEWLNDSTSANNPLRMILHEKFSCYIDYKYMSEVFSHHSDMLKGVDWSVFGLEDRDGADSTLWIGSAGVYTPCHQDTYGFNLVAQIAGRKRWFLFPPSQTGCLYPTRVPYEESSVFSEVNIVCPDLHQHHLFKNSTPYVVDLEAGQVLYVPTHWWHFVESREDSISINTWVPVESDIRSRMEESVCRLLFNGLSRSLLSQSDQMASLNSGEVIEELETDMNYLNSSFKQYKESCSSGGAANNLHTFLRHFKDKEVTCQSEVTMTSNFHRLITPKRPYSEHDSDASVLAKKVCTSSKDHNLIPDCTSMNQKQVFRKCSVDKTSLCVEPEGKLLPGQASNNLIDIEHRACCSYQEIVALAPMTFEQFQSFLSEEYGYLDGDDDKSSENSTDMTEETYQQTEHIDSIPERVTHRTSAEGMVNSEDSTCPISNCQSGHVARLNAVDVIKLVLHPDVIAKMCDVIRDAVK